MDRRPRGRRRSQPHHPGRGVSVWYVYLIECRGGRLYTGITPDLAARFEAHRAGKGALFTRLNPPERMLAAQPFDGPFGGSQSRDSDEGPHTRSETLPRFALVDSGRIASNRVFRKQHALDEPRQERSAFGKCAAQLSLLCGYHAAAGAAEQTARARRAPAGTLGVRQVRRTAQPALRVSRCRRRRRDRRVRRSAPA